MDKDFLRGLARKYALQNAVFFGGKANAGAVIGKIIAENPESKGAINEIQQIAKEEAEKINRLSAEEQKKELSVTDPSLLEKSEKKQRKGLPELINAVRGSVVTRFPPEPNGYPHLGHAKAAIIDEGYARMYDGKFVLRFDDTNPAKEKKEYYEAIKRGLDWLGIKADKIKNTSDDTDKLYLYAEKLIGDGNAYVCFCKIEEMRKNRSEGKECDCRSADVKQTKENWKLMHSKFLPNEATLRLKTNMQNVNTAVRDPTLFRIIDDAHPIQGKKYRVWPTYDFSVAVEDHIDGVTHAMRTKEYELRDELYFLLIKLLNLNKPELIEFSRLEMENSPLSKRKINPLIERKLVSGWDDPRLPTLAGLRRRGILPEAIREFILSLGVAKSEAVVQLEAMESVNRKMIDPAANRYYFVADPIRVEIKGAPDKIVTDATLYPGRPEIKRYELSGKNLFVYISGEDAKDLRKDDNVRLMHLFNVKITKIGEKYIEGDYAGNDKSAKKLHWVPVNSPRAILHIFGPVFINDEFNKNSLTVKEGMLEPYGQTINEGERVQFERMGYAILEDKKTMKFNLIHK
ncbi:MAG: glutamate--tRNA ligase [Candidatus Aenigmarchaeota archaeon]|nr:glutamate--tRNA ligase [Candidatus Aenigmarchaeota archaeon]